MFLMVFGMAIRGYQLVCAFWEVVSSDRCGGWKLLCFPCISVIWGEDGAPNSEVFAHVPTSLSLERVDSRRRRNSVDAVAVSRRRSSVGISEDAPKAEAEASRHFAVGRPLSHPLYGAGWAVENVDATFVVCFPDGSSATYALAMIRHEPNVLQAPRALDRGRLWQAADGAATSRMSWTPTSRRTSLRPQRGHGSGRTALRAPITSPASKRRLAPMESRRSRRNPCHTYSTSIADTG